MLLEVLLLVVGACKCWWFMLLAWVWYRFVSVSVVVDRVGGLRVAINVGALVIVLLLLFVYVSYDICVYICIRSVSVIDVWFTVCCRCC